MEAAPNDEMTLVDDFHSRYAPPETRSGGNSLSWGGCGGNSRRSDHAHFEALAAVSLMLQRHSRAPGFIWEVICIVQHAYARLYFGLLRTAFAHTFHLPNSRSVLLKVYVDRNPRFTAAKAGGTATRTLRNVPPSYTPEDIRTFLMHQDDDPGFLRIPAVINFKDDSPPALLNISSHVCSLCGNNHRDVDHEIFPTKPRQRLTNKQQLSVALLQQANTLPIPLTRLYPPDPPFPEL
ncbi:unnamed protein product [Closterium sp. NIES-64]|nr:unnamed protein product [Closterium sp. NIES-64]